MSSRSQNIRREASDEIDIQSLNQTILMIDLDALEIETLDQRIEMSLATLFGDLGSGEPSDLDSGISSGSCEQFTCTGYWPS